MRTSFTPSPTVSALADYLRPHPLEEAFSPCPLLLGNSFPLPLVHRPVRIEPRSLDELKNLASTRPLLSFWGHENTLSAAAEVLGKDITPRCKRPALRLSADGLPQLDGRCFEEVWVLSPVLPDGYRSPEWQPVPPGLIKGWNVLHLAFTIAA